MHYFKTLKIGFDISNISCFGISSFLPVKRFFNKKPGEITVIFETKDNNKKQCTVTSIWSEKEYWDTRNKIENELINAFAPDKKGENNNSTVAGQSSPQA